MRPEDIPYIHPSKLDHEWIAHQKEFIRLICEIFKIPEDQIRERLTNYETNVERALHGNGASGGEAQ